MQKIMKKESANLLASVGLDAPTLRLDDGSLLESLEIVRYLPNRRCVSRGVWQGKPVYVKLFFGAHAKRYALRDVDGVNYFLKANILTPKMLYQGELKQPESVVIVFEAIVTAENAEDFWGNSNEQARLLLAKQLMKTLAAHHQAGLVQTDLHLKNFLVDSGAIYSIDGDGVRYFGVLTKERALNNLYKLLSKLDVLMLAQHLPVLLQTYAAARSWQDCPKC